MKMKTEHKVFFSNSNNMKSLPDNSIDLVVTSPPYPMIEMWDAIFSAMNPEIQEMIAKSDGKQAFKLMHNELDQIWKECTRVLKSGGIICINIGDATRKIGKNFALYPNHSRIIEFFFNLGFSELPSIIWRKQTNSPNKFMGSGMLPTNAYVTLEHEYILIFRKGNNRKFQPKLEERYKSAYFWEERNQWFSDIWMDLKGTSQRVKKNSRQEIRERSAAFPLDLPYRLINMFSICGDTVLDPFWGTGTTSLASMIAARNSVGFELNADFYSVFQEKMKKLKEIALQMNLDRIKSHIEFLELWKKKGKEIQHLSKQYGFGVITKQEIDLTLKSIESVKFEKGKIMVGHSIYIENFH
jgi:DNA modification methylase